MAEATATLVSGPQTSEPRSALRLLRRPPSFSAASLYTLALRVNMAEATATLVSGPQTTINFGLRVLGHRDGVTSSPGSLLPPEMNARKAGGSTSFKLSAEVYPPSRSVSGARRLLSLGFQLNFCAGVRSADGRTSADNLKLVLWYMVGGNLSVHVPC